MSRPRPLPPELMAPSFSTRAALIHGVRPGRLTARDLTHPFHGVNAPSGLAGDIRDRCSVYSARMLDGQVFSHRTAALLHGMPVPGHGDDEPLHVSVRSPRTPPRARGVHGHSLRRLSTMVVNGLPVCTPAQVWVQLGGTLTADELVAIGDHIVGARRRAALATVDDLALEAARSGTTKGAAALRWAAGRIRWGADSRPESLLRLAIIREGLPEPLVNQPVSFPDGTVIHPDLVFADCPVALEYEGDGHRTDAAQWHRDIRRYERMVSAGWRVLRVTSRDLFMDRPHLMVRVRAVRSCEKRG